jgi:hypothetical protein
MLSPISTLGRSARVVLADAYGDGMVWFAFEDAEGRYSTVCIDGRQGSPTRYRLFDMARHPKKPSAVLLDLGSAEEGIVIPLVSRWLDSAPPRVLGLHDIGWELLRDTLIRIGSET